MAVYRANAKRESTKKDEKGKKEVTPHTPLSEEAMMRLARVMNDSPTIVKLNGSEWAIRALKPGTQWLIAEEACKVIANENMTMGDVIKQFATNASSVCRVITLAILNDKERIYGKEYQELYDALMWGDCDIKQWAFLLSEILSLIDVDFFFASTNAIKTLRQTTLDRKVTMEEQK